MPRNSKLSTPAANVQANALAALLASGYLRIYDGQRPSGADGRIENQKLLAELRFGSPAFAAAVDGVIKANPLKSDNKAAATGTASWYRCFQSDGVTPVLDGTVGIAGADLVMNSIAIQVGAKVSVSEFVHAI